MSTDQIEFKKFPKIPRAHKVDYVVTEKIDGTNAQLVIIAEPKEELKASQNKTVEIIVDGTVYLLFAGSRNRWITPDDDNFNFAQYVYDNAEELVKLGPGRHLENGTEVVFKGVTDLIINVGLCLMQGVGQSV